jgi:hypothetical protein
MASKQVQTTLLISVDPRTIYSHPEEAAGARFDAAET